jgi:diphosphomevalonate decarboxylase
MSHEQRATAVAHPNIALAKYWGKRGWGDNLPAVPSLSLTLAGLETRTTVRFDPGLARDRLVVGGVALEARPLARVGRLLDLVWAAGRGAGASEARSASLPPRPCAEVTSANDFPTAAGLASSASAFAALAVAAASALSAPLSPGTMSDLARRISASAGRSLFGGFVSLAAAPAEPTGQAASAVLEATPLLPASHWDLRVIVAVTTEAPKAVGSTEGMLRTAATSPFYAAWLEGAPLLYESIVAAVRDRDLDALAPVVEQGALAMHAAALAAVPGLVYWSGVTVELVHAVRRLRNAGTPAFFTIDAGPHLKAFTTPEHAAQVERALAAVPGVVRTIAARPGEGARVLAGPGEAG